DETHGRSSHTQETNPRRLIGARLDSLARYQNRHVLGANHVHSRSGETRRNALRAVSGSIPGRDTSGGFQRSCFPTMHPGLAKTKRGGEVDVLGPTSESTDRVGA